MNNNQKANPQQIETDNNFNRPPSIPSKTVLYIPFNFYFCENIKEALPIHIFDKIKFEISLNRYK